MLGRHEIIFKNLQRSTTKQSALYCPKRVTVQSPSQADSARLPAQNSAIFGQSHALVENHDTHESGDPAKSTADSDSWTYAGSAATSPQAARNPQSLAIAENGTKIDPIMGYAVVFEGRRVAVFTPDDRHSPRLSHLCEILFEEVVEVTARKYIRALIRLLDVGCATPANVTDLFASLPRARRALSQMLRTAGCRLTHSLPAKAVLVEPPRPLVRTIDLAFTALTHIYDHLHDFGELAFDNPIRCETPIEPVPGLPRFWRPARHFVLGNREKSLPLVDNPICSTQILRAGAAWPAGILAATRLTADAGDRISETLDLAITDWAASGFGNWLACPNKGSGGQRTKRIYLDEAQQAWLRDYVDGPRRKAGQPGFDALKKLAQRNPEHPALRAPLFLNKSGKRIKYSLYNDYYFRPTMQRAGIAATPHWLRHEHAINALLTIDTIARDPAHKADLIETYATLQGWKSGAQMVDYYTAWLKDSAQRALVPRLAESLRARRESAAWNPSPRAPGATMPPPVLAAFLHGASA